MAIVLSGCGNAGVERSMAPVSSLANGEISRRPVATYSIVARDAATGQLGVAVQSHWFSVGSVVPWGEAGVGVVATQSFVDVRYGPGGLALMRGGRDAGEALKALTSSDSGEAVRQVAMIDAKGTVASHTGASCIAEANHVNGKAPDGSVYSCQANMMGPKGVPEAMAKAFEGAGGPLAERLLAALEAAQKTGGDIRGRQSAAMLVVKGEMVKAPWEGRLVDLRIEDNPQPLEELRRLVRLAEAYELMNQGDLAMEKSDIGAALEKYNGAQTLCPENIEMVYWTGVSLANAGKLEQSLPLFKRAFADRAGDWKELTRRLPKSGLLKVDASAMERILAQ